MANIGFVCPTATGHLNPMLAIGDELAHRGHQIFFYQLLDVQKKIESHQVIFRAFGTKDFPKGRWNELLSEAGKLSGMGLLRHSIKWLSFRNICSVQETPELMKKDNLNLIVADEVGLEGRTLADLLSLPFVTISSGIVMAEDAYVPPFFTPWKFGTSLLAQMRNKLAYAFASRLRRDAYTEMNNVRKIHGLQPLSSRASTNSTLLHISQLIAKFDFPRKKALQALQYVGPLVNPAAVSPTTFPFEKLGSRPLIYVSLGSVMGAQTQLFTIIAEACADIDADLVMTTGGAPVPDVLRHLPGSPIVVEYAPQIELLKRARLCITHAGLNTVLESLSFGVPLIAIPLGNDQFGVASRIAWTSTGFVFHKNKIKSEDLRNIIQRELKVQTFKKNAAEMQLALASAGGVKKAATLIEAVLTITN